MKNAIVTGAAGFVGIHLVKELVEKKVSVVAVCRPGSTHTARLASLTQVKIVECELNDVLTLSSLVERKVYDVFYHIAWDSPSGLGRTNPCLQAENAMTACNCVLAAKELGCEKFVAVGTVYEKFCDNIAKSSKFSPPAFYLLSKQYAHNMTQQLSAKLDIDFAWCTCFHPIGEYIKPEQLMAYTVSSLLSGESPSYGSANEPFDIFAVEDFAYGLYLAGEKKLGKSEYYIGSGNPRILSEYLKLTQKQLNPEVELKIGSRADDGLRFSFDWYDISDFQKETGYKPRHTFEQAVQNVAEWVKENMSQER